MDKINITVLEDGTLSIETDAISGPNHMSADEFLAQVEKLVGSKTSEKNKARVGTHTHNHGGIVHSH